ncbi:MAG: hypoxanthine phosphoribosyltransferase [Deltaproteobacteria bacterium]|nr:MAG: hypoxanthine phosphoribosyltransferase [Deltaproteobacteria bacterium]RLB84750.1 MAG: hypoxanthine phosphoribosyltransferase [Deltaproteobacteria bacterium]
MEGYDKEILLSRDKIQERVRELALEISRDYQGKEPVLIGILNGVIFFFTDLIRNMTIPVKLDFIRAASYGTGTESSGVIRFSKDVEIDIRGQEVIVVEDIVDTGLTLSKIKESLQKKGPSSVKICVLIDKRERRETEVTIDYCGFRIDEGFIVGYGLDFNEQYRHLPDIFVLKEKGAST